MEALLCEHPERQACTTVLALGWLLACVRLRTPRAPAQRRASGVLGVREDDLLGACKEELLGVCSDVSKYIRYTNYTEYTKDTK